MDNDMSFNIPFSYIGWISDDKLAWQINAGGLAADTAVEISARPIPQEPMVCY